jgi:hypothetical protein
MHAGWRKAEINARRGALGGYQCKSGQLPPYRRGMPKLTQVQQMELLADYAADMKVTVIAAKYGVAPSYVSKLAQRRGATMREPVEIRAAKSRAGGNRRKRTNLQSVAQRIQRLRQQLNAET